MRTFTVSSMLDSLSSIPEKLKKYISRYAGLAAISVFIASGFSSVASADEAAASDPKYPAIGVHAGVWDDGQAALWDLNVLDHFRIFGAEERARGYKPEQPIAFSHITHVQLNKMDCQYCHWTVDKSPYAAIPEVETCMGCHTFIRGTDDTQKKEISKLDWYYQNSGIPFFRDKAGSLLKNSNGELVDEAGKAIVGSDNKALRDLTGEAVGIPWEKVHVTPNFVKFNHKRHIKGGVSCASCHGQIPEMKVVERVTSMKMGWCISCHREEGASIDCTTCHH
jgi:hypothetical protein